MPGLNRVRYRYRLLPHVLALDHAGGAVADSIGNRLS